MPYDLLYIFWHTSNHMSSLRDYLRSIRVSRGISQDELADNIGISRQKLMRWENGKTSTIAGEVLILAIAYLKIPFTDILAIVQAESRIESNIHAQGMTSYTSTDIAVVLESLESHIEQLEHDVQILRHSLLK